MHRHAYAHTQNYTGSEEQLLRVSADALVVSRHLAEGCQVRKGKRGYESEKAVFPWDFPGRLPGTCVSSAT